jgi:hypothetical protein
MRKYLVGLCALAFVVGSMQPSSAVENGVSAAGDSRIVSLYQGQTYGSSFSINHPNCSGFLITSRIVATAQHCTWNRDTDQGRPPGEIFVGKPGVKSTVAYGQQFAVAAVYRAADYKTYTLATDLSYTNDVAVLVLKKPLVNIEPAGLLNSSEFADLILKNPEVWIGGYGLQSFADRQINPGARFTAPAKAPASFANQDDFRAAINQAKSQMNRSRYQEDMIGLKMMTTTGTICDGDSGSGFWTTVAGKTIFLGTMNGPIGITNCQGRTATSPTTYAGVHPTYLYQDLYDQAADYVKAHPVKTTLTCKKGSLKKKVTAVAPKCPKGYKTAK